MLADADRPGSWLLLVDGIAQSYVDLRDPRHLELEYMRRLGHLVDLAASPGEPLRVLHLGGGGLTLARYVAATRPGSAQLAVDFDPRVTELVRRRLPLDRLTPPRYSPDLPPERPGGHRAGTEWISEGIRLRVGDARAVLEQVPAGSFDVVVADVFAGGSTPAHVTSVQFTAAVAAALAPSGGYAVNVADGPPLAHARGRVAATRSVFGHLCLIAEADVLRGRRYGNLIVAAAGHELPVAGLTRRLAADPFPARLLDGAALDEFVAGSPPITDADAEPSPTPPPDTFF